jgi:hypothetical protein
LSFFDLFWAADWDGLYRYLAKGYPPLILQILAINTIFFILYVVRRLTSKYKMRKSNLEMVQALLLVANLAVVFQEYAWKWIEPNIIQKLI